MAISVGGVGRHGDRFRGASTRRPRAALAMESIKSKVPSPLARALSDVAEADGLMSQAAESRKLA